MPVAPHHAACVLVAFGFPGAASAAIITGNAADAEIAESTASLTNTGGETARAGQSSDDGRNAVFVFELPDLASLGGSVTSAELGLSLTGLTNASIVNYNADLYALGGGGAATPPATYYEGGNDGALTRLVNDFATPATTPGQLTHSGVNLVAFLQAQYAAGNQFVYFRLSPDAARNNTRGYNFATAENADAGLRPVLAINQPIPEPASLTALVLGAGAVLLRR